MALSPYKENLRVMCGWHYSLSFAECELSVFIQNHIGTVLNQQDTLLCFIGYRS